MDRPILETKLRVPERRRTVLARPRLVEDMTREAALTVVSAPPGFGKTTLLVEWAATQPDGSVAWLSLDAGDSSPDVFWAHVIAALQKVAPEVGDTALALLASPAGAEAAIVTLLNDLDDVDRVLSLVIDDYHLVESIEVHESLGRFVDRLPGNVHVVISTRSDPALPLARLRGSGRLSEVRASDLQFTAAEADAYLTDLMGIPLDEGQVAALERRTEGWAAALQLSALSMTGLDDVSGFVDEFAGTDRYVVDYLVEEVLDRQPEDVRRFLLESSVLNRLTGPLCDAVTGRGDGAATLETLERANLLIVPLDGRRQWYRYHHLFADVLRARIGSEQPDLVPQLHRRAADWHQDQGDMSEAISHAIAAKDYDHAAGLVELAVPARRQARDEATMRRWYEALPRAVFENRPVLCIGYVGALLASGELEGVEDLLQNAERWAEAETGAGSTLVATNRDELRRLPGAIALYRSGQALMTGHQERAIAEAERALQLVGPDDDLERGGAAGLLALTHWTRGDLDAAFESWATATESLGRAAHMSDMAGCSISMADIRVTEGRLSDAVQIYETGLRATTGDGQPLRGAADMHVGIGEVLRERNDLAGARQRLEQARELGESNGLPQNLYRARLLEGRIREAEGDLEGALELVSAAKQVYFTDFSPDVRPVAAVEARLQVRLGRLSEARRWADRSGLGVDDEAGYLTEFGHVTLARVLLADAVERRDDALHAAAIDFLTRLLAAAEGGGRTANAIEILVVTAVALGSSGQERALDYLERALGLAEPEGFTRVFLDEGAAIAGLLETARAHGSGHAGRLLSGVRTEPPTSPAQVLVDPLTERELEVLRLLGTDMSGPEIAREMYVSLNTLRTHTKSIYLKLGVGSRRAALRRAAELDLP